MIDPFLITHTLISLTDIANGAGVRSLHNRGKLAHFCPGICLTALFAVRNFPLPPPPFFTSFPTKRHDEGGRKRKKKRKKKKSIAAGHYDETRGGGFEASKLSSRRGKQFIRLELKKRKLSKGKIVRPWALIWTPPAATSSVSTSFICANKRVGER